MLRPISPERVLFLDFWVSNIPRYFCFCLDALKTLRINQSRPHNLATSALEDSLVHSIDYHQVVETQKETSTKLYTTF